jgi:hypothetical protein
VVADSYALGEVYVSSSGYRAKIITEEQMTHRFKSWQNSSNLYNSKIHEVLEINKSPTSLTSFNNIVPTALFKYIYYKY